MKCANCSGSHTSNSRYCSQMRLALEMEREKAQKKVGFPPLTQDSSVIVSSRGDTRMYAKRTMQENPPSKQIVPTQEEHEEAYSSLQQISYSDMLTGAQIQGSRVPVKQMVNAATQTDNGNIRDTDKYENYRALFESMKKFMVIILVQFNQIKDKNQSEQLVETAFQDCFGVDTGNTEEVNNKEATVSGKRYPTRKQGKSKSEQEMADIDKDTFDEGVISSQDSSSESESLYETVEKRKIRVNPTKMLTASDFNKDKSSNKGPGTNTKRKKKYSK